MTQYLFAGIAFCIGGGLSAQAAINTSLRQYVGGTVMAAAVSFLVGLLFLAVVAAASAAAGGVSPLRLGAAPWWVWLGGLIGAAYILLTVVLTPRIGVGVMIAGAVAGQLVAALLIDNFGWFGSPVHPATPLRIAGVALLIGGVVLIRFF